MINRRDIPIHSGFHRRHGVLLNVCQQGVDLLVITAVLYLTARWRAGAFDVQYQMLVLLTTLLVLVIYRWTGTYSNLRFGGVLDDAKALVQPWLLVLICILAAGFLTKTTELFSRQVVVTWAVLGYLGQVLVHSVVRIILRSLRERGFNIRYAAIVGTLDQVSRFEKRLRTNPWLGIEVTGWVGSPSWESKIGSSALRNSNLEYLGDLHELDDIVSDHGIDMIYITLPMYASEALRDAARATTRTAVDAHWVPDIGGFQLVNHSVWEVDEQPIITLSHAPYDGFKELFKWCEDKLLAVALLVLFVVPMLIVSIVVKLTSPGPVFFRQKRQGLDGETFEILKFRTMVLHDEPTGIVTQATPSDPRVTRVGSFLRQTSLDELPQLINVLFGDMSLVGPRPHALEHNDYYRERINTYMFRHRIKPGITGLAQVHGHRGRTQTEDDMRRRLQYDILYINNWSPWLDVKILLLTVACVFSKQNAY